MTIFATVQHFPFKFRTLVSTQFLSVEIDYCTFSVTWIQQSLTPRFRNPHFSTYELVLKTRQIRVIH